MKGTNDMPYGWASKNKKLYRTWKDMLRRCYDEKYHKRKRTYESCYICERWLLLSNFIEDFPKITGYNEEKFLAGELELDKDIKSNGTNKCYCLKECMLVSKKENIRQSNKTMDYKSEEYRRKISESQFLTVAQINKNTNNIINVFHGIKIAEESTNIAHQSISKCCKGNLKSAGGYIWKYLKDVSDDEIKNYIIKYRQVKIGE